MSDNILYSYNNVANLHTYNVLYNYLINNDKISVSPTFVTCVACDVYNFYHKNEQSFLLIFSSTSNFTYNALREKIYTKYIHINKYSYYISIFLQE